MAVSVQINSPYYPLWDAWGRPWGRSRTSELRTRSCVVVKNWHATLWRHRWSLDAVESCRRTQVNWKQKEKNSLSYCHNTGISFYNNPVNEPKTWYRCGCQ